MKSENRGKDICFESFFSGFVDRDLRGISLVMLDCSDSVSDKREAFSILHTLALVVPLGI